MKKKKKDSLYKKFIIMTILPMLFMGIIIISVSSKLFNDGIKGEIKVELANVANILNDTYDLLYPGDYSMVGEKNVAIVKGETVISTQTEMIDSIKEKSQVEVSLFYYNTRFLTTIEDEDGNRLIGTVVNSKVEEDVLKTGKPKFYDNAVIDNRIYYAYYAPLFNSDGSCVGMLAVTAPESQVKNIINDTLFPLIAVSVIVMIIAGLVIGMYSKKVIIVLEKIRKYLNYVSKGNFHEELDIEVMKREDELGEIGKSIASMTTSLKQLVEIDMLTGISNRRCGEQKLKETQKNLAEKGMDFTIALGDIDYFKKVNDAYGHQCGDEVLKSVANLLKKAVIGKGYVVRWGGEEFLIIFDKVSYKEAKKTLEMILDDIRNQVVNYNEQEVKVTMTFGVTKGSADEELHHQIKNADTNLYIGKEAGRNRIIE